MKKSTYSSKGFYAFTFSLLMIGAIITGIGLAVLFSGHVLSAHAQFRLWVVIITFFFIAVFSLIRLIIDIATIIINYLKKKKQ